MDFYLFGDVTWTQNKLGALVDIVGAAIALGRSVLLLSQSIEEEESHTNQLKTTLVWERYFDITRLFAFGYPIVNSTEFVQMWERSPPSMTKKGYCKNYYQLSSKHTGVTGWGGSGGATPQKMLNKGIFCVEGKLIAFPLDARHPGQPYSDENVWNEVWGGWDDIRIKQELGPLDEQLLVMVTPAHMYQFSPQQTALYRAIRCRVQLSLQVREAAYQAMIDMQLLHPSSSSSSSSSPSSSITPFMCIHYRRGEPFRQLCAGRLPKDSCWQEDPLRSARTVNALIAKFSALLRPTRTTTSPVTLFVMTNEDLNSKHWRLFTKGLLMGIGSGSFEEDAILGAHNTSLSKAATPGVKRVALKLYHPPSNSRDAFFNVLVEQSICADSQVFLRNGWSSFSMETHQERICRGFSPDTSLRWGTVSDSD